MIDRDIFLFYLKHLFTRYSEKFLPPYLLRTILAPSSVSITTHVVIVILNNLELISSQRKTVYIRINSYLLYCNVSTHSLVIHIPSVLLISYSFIWNESRKNFIFTDFIQNRKTKDCPLDLPQGGHAMWPVPGRRGGLLPPAAHPRHGVGRLHDREPPGQAGVKRVRSRPAARSPPQHGLHSAHLVEDGGAAVQELELDLCILHGLATTGHFEVNFAELFEKNSTQTILGFWKK